MRDVKHENKFSKQYFQKLISGFNSQLRFTDYPFSIVNPKSMSSVSEYWNNSCGFINENGLVKQTNL